MRARPDAPRPRSRKPALHLAPNPAPHPLHPPTPLHTRSAPTQLAEELQRNAAARARIAALGALSEARLALCAPRGAPTRADAAAAAAAAAIAAAAAPISCPSPPPAAAAALAGGAADRPLLASLQRLDELVAAARAALVTAEGCDVEAARMADAAADGNGRGHGDGRGRARRGGMVSGGDSSDAEQRGGTGRSRRAEAAAAEQRLAEAAAVEPLVASELIQG